MKKELDSRYNPSGLEKKWYTLYEKKNIFSHKINSHYKKKDTFSMVIPPPNVTGSLHLGHALNHTIQDILARYHKMQGKTVLWVPGTDHAGIATQNVVEKQLHKQNIHRQDLTRQAFEDKIWDWRNKSGGMITQQQRELGESVNWEYERFTLDPGVNKLVRLVFIELYNQKLIYRAKRMINWCPTNQTALSNIEVEYKNIKGSLYHIQYPLKNKSNSYITIATTRPETMLGDEAIAVNPKDERYQNMIGNTAIIPIINKEIPIVADEYVDRHFGTGAVKITPAHDPNDFEMGKRHSLPVTQVIDWDGKMNKNALSYKGLSREQCRTQLVKDLKEKDFLKSIEKYEHKVGHSYRSGAIVEPLPSQQWFVDMKPLAEKAIKAVKNKEIIFIPQRWENTFFEWMYNIQDWCISRQLWWGHRIPAYYDKKNNIYVGLSKEEVISTYNLPSDTELTQDKDVLDTWFSSALWSFATLITEEDILNNTSILTNTEDLNLFYPTSVLVTGFDIIFFWVARMIMMGTHFQKKIPFKKVYIHGLVRDAERQKMSKSKGNVVNPLEKMQEYGTDAFRFFMMSILPEGKDIIYDESRLKGYQAFCNKIWNTARFIWMNQDIYIQKSIDEEITSLSEIDIWLLQHFNTALEKINDSIENFRFADYTREIYDFTWKYFCDYYIELSKISLENSAKKSHTLLVLNGIFLNILKLLHPIMPFITEELFSYWQIKEDSFLLLQDWPKPFILENQHSESLTLVNQLLNLTYKIRYIRGELSIPPKDKVTAVFYSKHALLNTFFKDHSDYIQKLAKVKNFDIINENSKKEYQKWISTSIESGELYLDMISMIDINKEKKRITKETEKIKKEVSILESRLKNASFVKKAPAELIKKDNERLDFLQNQNRELTQILKIL